MDITFINVGYGESILITNEDHEYEDGRFVMLIDGGSALPSEYSGDSGRIRAIDFLRKHGIRHIDLLVFSHVHEDHTCGLVPIIENIPVRQYWTPVFLSGEHYSKSVHPRFALPEADQKALWSVNDYSRLLGAIPERKITRLEGIRPGYCHAAGLDIDILGPEPGYRDSVEKTMDRIFAAEGDEELRDAVSMTADSMNNASLILRLHYKGKKILLCGDTNAGGFRHIFETDPKLLEAEVFKLGHHGQPDSVTEELVRAVDPSVIVCCASNDHRSNSSSEKTFETIRCASGKKPVTYLFQDGLYNDRLNPETAPRNGVTVRVDADGISWMLS